MCKRERNPSAQRYPTDVVMNAVCGMSLSPDHAQRIEIHRGETFYFCSWGCGAAFRSNPSRYSDPEL